MLTKGTILSVRSAGKSVAPAEGYHVCAAQRWKWAGAESRWRLDPAFYSSPMK